MQIFFPDTYYNHVRGCNKELNEIVSYHEAKDDFLRLLTEYFILVRSAMFGATFDLVMRVGLPYL